MLSNFIIITCDNKKMITNISEDFLGIFKIISKVDIESL